MIGPLHRKIVQDTKKLSRKQQNAICWLFAIVLIVAFNTFFKKLAQQDRATVAVFSIYHFADFMRFLDNCFLL